MGALQIAHNIACAEKAMKELCKLVTIGMLLITAFIAPVVPQSVSFGITTARGGLTLRSHPDTESEGLSLIPVRTRVAILDRTTRKEYIGNRYGVWYQIRYERLQGWVFGAYIATQPLLLTDPVQFEAFLQVEAMLDKIRTYLEKWKSPRIRRVGDLTIASTSPDIEFAEDNNSELTYVFYTGAGNLVHLRGSPVLSSRGAVTVMKINDDPYPDLFINKWCCSNVWITVLLGGPDALTEVFAIKEPEGNVEVLKRGFCGEFEIRRNNQLLTFDCSVDRFRNIQNQRDS